MNSVIPASKTVNMEELALRFKNCQKFEKEFVHLLILIILKYSSFLGGGGVGLFLCTYSLT